MDAPHGRGTIRGDESASCDEYGVESQREPRDCALYSDVILRSDFAQK